MTVTAAQIMVHAAEVLQDNEHERWTLPELCRWLNMGQKAIILHKPSAKSITQVVQLREGTLQEVPQTGTPKPLRLIDVIRNITSDIAVTPRVAGRTIKTVSRDIIDSENAEWHRSRSKRFRKEVRHVCFDEQNPLEFYVYPGNTGEGRVEALLSVLPNDVVATGDVNLIGSYNVNIDLPDLYEEPLLDFVLHWAYAKDSLGNYATRSNLHYQKFAAAIGLKIQVEGATSPNVRRGQP